ncbi:MAG TPA: zinc-ribbon domain-containing protein [Tepidisphaeraceae bacterium]|jgi:predicted nucleic acid-binding Zn ribbon protein
MTKTCSVCHEEMPKQAAFCPRCGTRYALVAGRTSTIVIALVLAVLLLVALNFVALTPHRAEIYQATPTSPDGGHVHEAGAGHGR